MMKRTTERKWHSWLNGVALTICPSMWRRQRRLWWTSGETPLTTPHWPSTARLWRESAALNSWGCTSQRISPGPPTPCHSPKRHNSAYTFSAGWKEQVSLHPSSPHSTRAPLRVLDPPPQTPPNLTTPKKKLYETFFCAIRSVLHKGEWAYTNHL